MRTQLKNLAFPVLMVLAVVLVNFFVYYTSVCGAEIVQSRDIYGGTSSASISSVRSRTKLISKSYEELATEVELIRDYQAAVVYVQENDTAALSRWVELTSEERKNHALELYGKCVKEYSSDTENLSEKLSADISDRNEVLSYLGYLDGYQDYVADIANRSEFLSDISIYKEDSGIVGNIVKTQKDFYGLSGITLTPVVDDGYLALISYRITDILVVLVAVLSLTVLRNEGSTHRRGILSPVLITVIGTAAMYIGNYILTASFLGLPPMDAAVQSMESFKSCPYMINAGALVACMIAFKVLGALSVLFAVAVIVSTEGRRRAVSALIIGGVIFAEIVFAVTGISDILSEINILSFFSFERFFIRYLNLDIFGMAASRLPLFIVFAAVVFVVMATAAVRSISRRSAQLTQKAEQEYYDEINRRYLESRKIRHDINNHLLAINALIETGNIEQAKRYISEVQEQTDLAAMPVKTGRDVLDALLFKKTEQAAEKGAAIQYEVSCPLLDCSISDYDLCTIFGNILDNAIEAAKAGERISVSISKQHDMLYISCENPFEGELKRRGDRIVTTKKDFTAHGFGLMRIRETAKRCGGDVNITAEDGVFHIEVLMNL